MLMKCFLLNSNSFISSVMHCDNLNLDEALSDFLPGLFNFMIKTN